ncbi:MAG: hypothetical protein DNFNHJIP_00522 [Candidatus Argoarchaeum ethanivorans]|uniref:Uncharacterized protein n=1 Tax=Candidatus Argoarchaeum ethanivorans TaxID=2608793 RepID=A0A812A2U4_9EURY|nr:MAG: hypothetical protein DNFNHJIP_00522 [Candidatus Argoarchaeum ethanivorans]
MLLRSGSILAPAGIIASVLILSASFMSTSPLTSSESGCFFGSGLMFGPRVIFTVSDCLSGGSIIESLITKRLGDGTVGYIPSSLGSVSSPHTAAAMQVSTLAR